MSDDLRIALIRLAHTQPTLRRDLLPLITAALPPASNGGFSPYNIGEDKPGGSAEGGKGSDAGKPWMKDEFTQQENLELGEKQMDHQIGDGKVSLNPMKAASREAHLRVRLIRLAHDTPSLRKALLPLITAAHFPPDSIGEETGGAEGDKGSDAAKPWMKDEFTQQEFVELFDKQEDGDLSDGKADARVASERKLRAGLIRLAKTHPEFRKDILPLVTAAESKGQSANDHWIGLDPKKPAINEPAVQPKAAGVIRQK